MEFKIIKECFLILNYSLILLKQTKPFLMKLFNHSFKPVVSITWLILSIQVHIMWCLEDRLLEREMRKGNSVISRVKLKTLYSSPFGMKKHEPNQKENSLGYATLLLKTIFLCKNVKSIYFHFDILIYMIHLPTSYQANTWEISLK